MFFMRLYLFLFIMTLLANSCALIGAIGYGRSLSKAERHASYIHLIHDGYNFQCHSEQIENRLFQLLVDNKIPFSFFKMGYTDTDGILITLTDTQGARYTYNVTCSHAGAYENLIDSLLLNNLYTLAEHSWLNITSVTDSNHNMVNISNKQNKRFPGSQLHRTLDSLFNRNIAEPLIAMINTHKSCDKMVLKEYPEYIYQLLLTDTCTKETISAYTYRKDTTRWYTPHNFYNPIKVEKFYSRFALIDTFNVSGKMAKYLVEPKGMKKKIY